MQAWRGARDVEPHISLAPIAVQPTSVGSVGAGLYIILYSNILEGSPVQNERETPLRNCARTIYRPAPTDPTVPSTSIAAILEAVARLRWHHPPTLNESERL